MAVAVAVAVAAAVVAAVAVAVVAVAVAAVAVAVAVAVTRSRLIGVAGGAVRSAADRAGKSVQEGQPRDQRAEVMSMSFEPPHCDSADGYTDWLDVKAISLRDSRSIRFGLSVQAWQ